MSVYQTNSVYVKLYIVQSKWYLQLKINVQGPFKPVLNWANVCSPNILRTLRRTRIRFLIELLVRRTWFGQSKLYFVLNWLVMRCKLRPEHAADAQHTSQINKFPSKRVKNLATPSSIFLFSSWVHRRALLSANQRQWSSNRANVPRTCWASFWTPNIASTNNSDYVREEKLAQLRTN